MFFFALAFRISLKKINKMSRVCQLTGKSVMVGNNVSHSNRKTKRKFYPNLITKKFYLPEEDSYVTLKISTSALRTINKKGITEVMKEAREKGYLK
jgi:large subunit ribosomal protein L28